MLGYQTWLKTHLPPSSRIGIDPFLISAVDFQSLSREVKSSGHTVVPIAANIVDLVWKKRPILKLNAIEPLEFRFSGMCFDFFLKKSPIYERSTMGRTGPAFVIIMHHLPQVKGPRKRLMLCEKLYQTWVRRPTSYPA